MDLIFALAGVPTALTVLIALALCVLIAVSAGRRDGGITRRAYGKLHGGAPGARARNLDAADG